MFSFNQNTQLSRVLSLYEQNEHNNEYYNCKICKQEKKVNKPISGKSKANLRAHIAKTHPKEFVEFCAPSKKLPLVEKRKVLMQSFAEMISVNGRPFSCLMDSGFQRLIKNDLEELSVGGIAINFANHYQELKEYISQIASTFQNEIKEDLKGKHIAIMMDIGTKNNKSLLGISCQYVIKDDVVIHSLGVVPLHKSHTASYVYEKLVECLQVYNIPLDCVISITTDNARNMIATINKFDECLKVMGDFESSNVTITSTETNLIQEEVQTDQASNPLSESEFQEILDQAANEEELDRILNDEDDFEDLFSELFGNMSSKTELVNTVRCGAHTVQLMVRDAIDESNFKRSLNLCRKIVKLLRTEKYRQDAQKVEIGYALPLIYCTTRWDADLLMVIHK